MALRKAISDFDALLKDPEINLVDIVTPPFLHPDMVSKALGAGKNVICEKPLTGFLGLSDDAEPIGEKVSKSKMNAEVLKAIDALHIEVEKSDAKFLYAENFVYSAPVHCAAEIITKR